METVIFDSINGVNVLKLNGKVTMKNVVSVEEILDKSLKTPILDFSEVTYLDSTFLGLLAKYTMLFKKKNNEYLTIIKPNDEVKNILKQTGILKFLIILDKEIMISGKILDASLPDAKQILELHEILMELNDKNKKIFEPVVEQMKKVVELKNEKEI